MSEPHQENRIVKAIYWLAIAVAFLACVIGAAVVRGAEISPARVSVAGVMTNPLFRKGSAVIRIFESWKDVKVGARFGMLEVIGRPFKINPRTFLAVVQCQCGEIKAANVWNLPQSYSCGCSKSHPEGYETHGESRSKLYQVWHGMRRRCKSAKSKNYSQRGIVVCDDWQSYEPFAAWAKTHGFEAGKEIDRIDNDRGYSPDNCRFVSRKVNNNNKRTNKRLDAFGEVKTLMEWSEDSRCVVAYTCLDWRIRNGWETEVAITKPSGVTA